MGRIILLHPTPTTQDMLVEYAVRSGLDLTQSYSGRQIVPNDFGFHITILATESEVSAEGMPENGIYSLREPIIIKPSHISTIGDHNVPAIFCLRTRELQEIRERFETGYGLNPTFANFMPHISLSYVSATPTELRDVELPNFLLEFDRIEVDDFNLSEGFVKFLEYGDLLSEALAVSDAEMRQYQKEAKAVLGQIQRYLRTTDILKYHDLLHEADLERDAEPQNHPIMIHGSLLGLTGKLNELVRRVTFILEPYHPFLGGSYWEKTGEFKITNMLNSQRTANYVFDWHPDTMESVTKAVHSAHNYGKILAQRLSSRLGTFVHEWTHLRQFSRTEGVLDWSSYQNYTSSKASGLTPKEVDARNKAYHNHPGEVEAFISDLLQHIDKEFMRRLGGGAHAQPPVDEILSWLTQNHRMFESWWSELTPANRKDVRATVLSFYKKQASAAKERLGKKDMAGIEYELYSYSDKRVEITVTLGPRLLGKLEVANLGLTKGVEIYVDLEKSTFVHSKASSKVFVEAYKRALIALGGIKPRVVSANLVKWGHLARKAVTLDLMVALFGAKEVEKLIQTRDDRKTLMGLVAGTGLAKKATIERLMAAGGIISKEEQKIKKAVTAKARTPKTFANRILAIIKKEGTGGAYPISWTYDKYGVHFADAGSMVSFKERILKAKEAGLLRLAVGEERNLASSDKARSALNDKGAIYYFVGDPKTWR